MKPDFVIIGGQRSGSTSLMRVLGDHPHVFMPQGESRYFRDPWFQMQSADVLDEDMRTAKPNVRRRGIKCPDLLGEPPSARRLMDVLGPVDLIAVLREPVDRAISAYHWGMQWGWIPVAHPEVGLRRVLAGDYGPDYPRAQQILEYGLYGKHLPSFLEVFPSEKLLVVLDEDLRSDFAAAATRLLTYLGLDTSIPLQPPKLVNEGVYSERRLRLLQHRLRYILREYPGHPGKFLQPAVGARARVINRSISVVDRLLLARILDNSKPAISAALRGELYAYYRDDIDRLAALLGRDLRSWHERNERYIATHA